MASRAFFLACTLGLLSGCGNDQSQMSSGRACNSGVAIVLEGFSSRFAMALPVQLRACFDQDCDVVRIISKNGKAACDWDPGGPPAQLTTCTVRSDGAVEIDIGRVDGRDYGDGARHVVGISATNASGVLYSHVEEVRLVTVGDSACFVDGLDLTPLGARPIATRAGTRFG